MAGGAASAVSPQRDASALARQLTPALQQACSGSLGDIRWFTSDWQRGGAATGFASFHFDDGPREVVVKLPVGPVEHRATAALARIPDAPTPRLAAQGVELGGADLAWLVLERLPGEPLARSPQRTTLLRLAESAAAFWKVAVEALGPPAQVEAEPDWSAILDRSRHAAQTNHLPDEHRWKGALKRVQRALPDLLVRWSLRETREWRHGDLHPGNAMLRPDDSPWGGACCVLIDLAEVRPGSWIEDAVAFERLYWGREERLPKFKPAKELARARKRLDLPVEENWQEQADIRRALLASAALSSLSRDGEAKFLEGALASLERASQRLGL